MTSTTRSDDHERTDLSPHGSHGRDGRRGCEGAAQARAPSARARPQGRRASGGASYVGRRDNRRRSPRSRLASPRDGGRGGRILRLPIQRQPHRRGGVHRAGGDRGRRSVARQHVAEIGAPRSQKSRRARPLGERASVRLVGRSDDPQFDRRFSRSGFSTPCRDGR
jgi:hypothetical protein